MRRLRLNAASLQTGARKGEGGIVYFVLLFRYSQAVHYCTNRANGPPCFGTVPNIREQNEAAQRRRKYNHRDGGREGYAIEAKLSKEVTTVYSYLGYD